MVNQKKWSEMSQSEKRTSIIVIAIMAVIVIAIINGLSGANKAMNGANSAVTSGGIKQQTTSTSAPKQSEATQVTQATPAKTLTTQDKLWQAVDSTLKKRDNINISYDATEKVAFIDHTDENPYNAESFVRQAYTILALYGQAAFNIEGINHLNVQNKCKLTDAYGKDSVKSCVTIEMSKDQFSKFNWPNLDHLEVDNNIENASDIYIIVPAIKSQTKPSNLYLKLTY